MSYHFYFYFDTAVNIVLYLYGLNFLVSHWLIWSHFFRITFFIFSLFRHIVSMLLFSAMLLTPCYYNSNVESKSFPSSQHTLNSSTNIYNVFNHSNVHYWYIILITIKEMLPRKTIWHIDKPLKQKWKTKIQKLPLNMFNRTMVGCINTEPRKKNITNNALNSTGL